MSRKLTLDLSNPSPKPYRARPGTVPLMSSRPSNNPSILNHPNLVPRNQDLTNTADGDSDSILSDADTSTLATTRVSFRIPISTSANALSTQENTKNNSQITRSTSAMIREFTKNSFVTHKNEKIKSKSMDEIGVLKTSANEVYDFGVKDLKDLGQIGAGSFGTVNKMFHIKSQSLMAVKIIRVSVNESDQRQVIMDLGVIRKASYKHIVTFHGALFHEGDCWICMELMDLSAELLYRYVHHNLNEVIPERIMAQIALATVQALNYLKEKLGIIHRDVKPSNILLNQHGEIKLCDFGISGVLVDSIARTHDVGCRPYMAPERIDPSCEKDGYDIRSDVWSMGISLIEISTGSFPYRTWNSVFDQLQEVVTGSPPKLHDLPNLTFSPHFHLFIHSCLKKERKERPKYNSLLKSKFLELAIKDSHCVNISQWVTHILSKREKIPFPDQNKYSPPPNFPPSMF